MLLWKTWIQIPAWPLQTDLKAFPLIEARNTLEIVKIQVYKEPRKGAV